MGCKREKTERKEKEMFYLYEHQTFSYAIFAIIVFLFSFLILRLKN